MARRPAPPAPEPVGSTPAGVPVAAVEARPSPSPPPLLTADERLSPLFRSLRDIDAIDDPELRLQAALDRLDAISQMALGRQRTVGKDQHVILDPDCNAAVKVEEVAHRLLSVEPRRVKLKPPDLQAFEQPTPIRAIK